MYLRWQTLYNHILTSRKNHLEKQYDADSKDFSIFEKRQAETEKTKKHKKEAGDVNWNLALTKEEEKNMDWSWVEESAAKEANKEAEKSFKILHHF